jgi:hypothetical protein
MGEKKKSKKEMEMAISGRSPFRKWLRGPDFEKFLSSPGRAYKKKSHLISVVDLSESSEASPRASESIIEKE